MKKSVLLLTVLLASSGLVSCGQSNSSKNGLRLNVEYVSSLVLTQHTPMDLNSVLSCYHKSHFIFTSGSQGVCELSYDYHSGLDNILNKHFKYTF